ncbi:MAG: AzlC family ABC transporter permease [Peptococcaceae bacterium]|nr:AzlC family ABC transporter permease [Peptococcaceae bacterium]MBQ5682278.1 AzlC family ABC transporter permease [Peptococcaceae bacterium]MBQ5702400.1 AzlC family ABC transporter permease [Peptococcaceae bacterium]MBQ5858670.1 AzlC family ABC transporter permease [Peptococcaceae bacterium]
MKSAYMHGLRNGIPICLGYLSVSVTFGLMCTENNLPFWVAVLISMTNLTSAGQFAGTALIISGGSLFEIGLTTFVINIRYLLMSLSLSQKIDPALPVPQRLVMSFGVTDEIFGVSMQHKGQIPFTYFLGLMTLPFWGWASGTLIGAVAVSLLPDMVRSALGIAIYGMFLAVIIPPARTERALAWVIAIAAGISCLFYYLPVLNQLSSGWVIIICAIAASSFAAVKWPVKDEEEA